MTQPRDTFFVTLYSNATAGFPNNTPGSFGNQLAHTLELPRNSGWQVCLASLTCTNQFRQDNQGTERSINQVLVRCHELGVSYDARKLLSCHSLQSFDGFFRRVHTYEPKSLLFFPLDADHISSLHIELLSGNQQPLLFRRSQSTVCVLRFSKVRTGMHLPVWIHSNAGEWQGQGHARHVANVDKSQNKAQDFRVKLPPIFMNTSDQKWKIALTSFTFVPNFATVPKNLENVSANNIFHAVNLSDDENEFLNQLQSDDLHIPSTSKRQIGQSNWPRPPNINYTPVTMRADKWDSIQTRFDLVRTIQEMFAAFIMFKTNSDDPMFIIEFLGRSKSRVQLKFVTRSVLYLPIYIAFLLGFRDFATTSDGGLAVFAGNIDTFFVARRNIDIKALTPHSMSIVCDFIEPTFVAGVQSPVLKTFAISQRESIKLSSVTYEPTNLEFHNLNTRELHSLHFKIIGADGQSIEFTDNSQNIIVGLVIKTG